MRLRFPFSCLGLALSSCSLLTDTSGLSGSADAAPALDGGGAFPDAPAPSADGGGSADATTDPPSCSSPDTFCDDFESGSLLPGWSDTGEYTTQAGAIEIEAQAGPNGTKCARSVLDPQSGGCQNAFVEKALRGSYTRVRAEVDVRHELTVGTGTLMTVGLGDDEDRCEAYVDAAEDKLALYTQNYVGQNTTNSQFTAFTDPLPRGTWTRLVVEADFAAQTISIQIGALSRVAPLLPCALSPANVFVAIGLSCEKGAAAQRVVRYDNFVAQAKR